MFFCDLWAWMGSNHRPSGYEPRALPLSYRPLQFLILDLRFEIYDMKKRANYQACDLQVITYL